MPFQIATQELTPEGFMRLDSHRRVKLSGSTGPLACYISSLRERSGTAWSLSGTELARQLVAREEEDLPWVLLFSASSSSLLLVATIVGLTGDYETEILLRGACLLPVEGGYWQRSGVEIAEALILRGGWLTPSASWAWAPPKMSLGGAIVNPAQSTRREVASGGPWLSGSEFSISGDTYRSLSQATPKRAKN
ncbi:MAG: hypothetical protein N2035_09045 [Chthoniobacterales bacterium]|nr:hypothetical protein [Chthoniobacterales bacterium]